MLLIIWYCQLKCQSKKGKKAKKEKPQPLLLKDMACIRINISLKNWVKKNNKLATETKTFMLHYPALKYMTYNYNHLQWINFQFRILGLHHSIYI